jgi:calmodulin
MIADNLSDEKLIEYITAFEVFDKDKDGKITTKEIGTILRNLGQNPSEKQLNEMISEIDQDGNGTIDFNEFIGLIIKKMKEPDLNDEMIDAFSIFDKDGNKFITSHEMRNVLRKIKIISDDDIEELVKEADIDGDGQIDYEEFIRMVVDK